MKRTKIIATIGPSSDTKEKIKKLIKNGVNVARLNFSHGDLEEKQNKINLIRKIDSNIGIMLDTKGPEIRTCEFEKETYLEKNNIVVIRSKKVIGNNKEFSLNYNNFFKIIKKNQRVLIDDGLVELKVISIDNNTKDVVCKVINSGFVDTKKGVNLPDSNIDLVSPTKKDIEDIKFGIKNNINFIALSFVRTKNDVLRVKNILKRNKAENILIISKIEHRDAVENIEDIISVSDGVMVARGDLAVEYDFEKIPYLQDKIIKLANKKGKISIVATQMLDSMIRNPRPTRSEVTDVANAINSRADCVMLSGETAKGNYPIDSVKVMTKIIIEAEKNLIKNIDLHNLDSIHLDSYKSEAISRAAVLSSNNLDINKIIVPTKTGYSARLISKYRPKAKIYALVMDQKILQNMSIVYGIAPFIVEESKSFSSIIKKGLSILIKNKCINFKEKIVICGAYNSKKTNSVMISRISDFIQK